MTDSPTPQAPSRWLLIGAFASLYLIWGSTYLGIRIAIETIPPFLMAGTRFVVPGAILIFALRRRGMPRPPLIHWRSAAIVGGLLMLGGNGGVTWAEQRVPSSLAALMIGATPIWIAVLGWLVFGSARPTRIMTVGLVSGLAGVALLAEPDEIISGSHTTDPAGIVALLIAALCWAIGSLYSRRAPLPSAPLLATGMQMLTGGLMMLGVGTVLGEWNRLDLAGISARSALAVVYLSSFGSLIAFSAYIWLLRVTTPARATSYAYVNPVVALFLGWALASEPVTPRMLIAAAMIVGSVVVITSVRAQGRPVPRPDPAAPAPLPAQSRAGR